eukprot:CAMPEP_0114497662 /NCGR_PEP_ID=MMETSP0109-20121206/6453_1 /TAXON_ID=29199 /ORGANISM="Chlorarachnion reptans, Strain CCCM449" /LENGTH=636 /DNA_ID=CAMNT_0001675077 /DNA_START=367 /DNA_END=2277 /DNA_ORIENTATION=-
MSSHRKSHPSLAARAERLRENRRDTSITFIRFCGRPLGIQNEQNGSDKEKSGLSLGKAGATVLDSNEIQGFEESVVLHNQDHQDRENLEQMILELKRWLKAGGAEFSDLDVKEYFEEVRGIESTSKLSKGSEIISIPLEYIITDILAASSAIGSKIEALFPPSEERTHSYYAMHGYLLEEMEKGSESFWWPYLRLLPRKFPGHPLIWEKKDKKLLSGTLSLKYLNRQLHQLREDYNKMVVGIPGFGRFSFKDFVWAHLVISTRCYSAEIKGVKASAMVPLADMFNHELENPGATWGYQDDHHAFIVTMDKDMERGAQISVPYGGYSSSRLFTHYGFQVPGDRHYDALVVVGFGERAFELMPKYLCAPTIRLFSYLRQEIDWLDKTHPNVSMHHEDYLISFHRRSTALQKLLSVPESDLTFGTNLSSAIPAGGERDTQEMLESVREKEIDLEERIGPAMKNITAEAQLASVENKWEGPEDEQLLDPTKFISRRNEIRVLREIRKACLDALMFFPTTLDKDVEALTKYSSRMSWAQRNCIVATAGEKQTLMWFVTLANIAEPLLTRSKPHVDLFLKRRKELKKDIFTEYIDLVVKPLTRGIWPEDQPGGETSTYSPILKPRKHKGLVSPGIANNTIGE